METQKSALQVAEEIRAACQAMLDRNPDPQDKRILRRESQGWQDLSRSLQGKDVFGVVPQRLVSISTDPEQASKYVSNLNAITSVPKFPDRQ